MENTGDGAADTIVEPFDGVGVHEATGIFPIGVADGVVGREGFRLWRRTPPIRRSSDACSRQHSRSAPGVPRPRTDRRRRGRGRRRPRHLLRSPPAVGRPRALVSSWFAGGIDIHGQHALGLAPAQPYGQPMHRHDHLQRLHPANRCAQGVFARQIIAFGAVVARNGGGAASSIVYLPMSGLPCRRAGAVLRASASSACRVRRSVRSSRARPSSRSA